MNRYLSIDVLRGLIMIIMALDHVIGEVGSHPALEASIFPMTFSGYTSPGQQWSRLLTHLCAPGFQLLAGMGLAISVARAQASGTVWWRTSLDLFIRGSVLILADFFLMKPVFGVSWFFMVLACIGSCTLCFLILRHLPRDLIGIVGLLIILHAPLYAPTAFTPLSSSVYYTSIWTKIGFGLNGEYGILYPILPWLGVFCIGWWIGLKLFETPREEPVTRSASWISGLGVILVLMGLGLRMLEIPWGEKLPLKGAGILDATFWQFTKYPPSWVFLSLTLGILLFLLGILRVVLDRPGRESPGWARFIAVYGRTALFYFIVHFYVIQYFAKYVGIKDGPVRLPRYPIAQCYEVWFMLLAVMWPLCFFYDKLRQRFRLFLRYF